MVKVISGSKGVLIFTGVILEFYYLWEIFSSGMGAPYTGPVNSTIPLMTLPFVIVSVFRSRFGGVLLILTSLVSGLTTYLTEHDWHGNQLSNFKYLIWSVKYFGPMMVLGIGFLIISICVKNIEKKKHAP